MKTTILTLCDFAKDYNGQLSIQGTFNQILSDKFPSMPISFAIACQFTISSNIVGSHVVEMTITDKDSGTPLIPKQDFRLQVDKATEADAHRNLVTNFILNIDKIIFDHPGTYTLKVVSDGNIQELDFYVVQPTRPPEK